MELRNSTLVNSFLKHGLPQNAYAEYKFLHTLLNRLYWICLLLMQEAIFSIDTPAGAWIMHG